MSSAVGQAGLVELEHGGFPHLSLPEWIAYERMRRVLGESTVVAVLQSLSPMSQKDAAVNFMHNEVTGTQGLQATPVTSNRVFPLKIDVSSYKGSEREPLLRWFVELDAAIEARQLRDQYQQVAFTMSKLGGRAKSWEYGKRLAGPNCFSSYADFMAELRQAFEPPKCEFRARAEFLELRQGRMDLHEYAQRAICLVSSIVCDPIDCATQVMTFMKGLNDGPVRTQLFRAYPQSMEEAISLALQEEFSLKQVKIQGPAPRYPRYTPASANDPEPIGLSHGEASQAGRPRNDSKCFRCGKPGHSARNCKVSLPGGNRHTEGALAKVAEMTSKGRKRARTVGQGLPTGPVLRTVVVEPQDSGPEVLDAHAFSTKSETRRSLSSALIVIKVKVDGFEEPLHALIDTGASNNFVREQVVKSHGIDVPGSKTGMVVRLTNGATVQMAKRVIRLKMRFEEF